MRWGEKRGRRKRGTNEQREPGRRRREEVGRWVPKRESFHVNA